MNTYTIGQVSKIANVSTKTIRFYEESGIIPSAQRADNGYRVYSQKAVDELTLIMRARDLGLPIREIKKLMKGCESESCNHTMSQVSASIDEYSNLLAEKIQQFTVLQEKLGKLKDNLCMSEKECAKDRYCCNILRQLVEIH